MSSQNPPQTGQGEDIGPPNPRNPKIFNKQAARDAAEEKARKLLGQAVMEIRKAEGLEHEAIKLVDQLSGLTKKSIKTYWEAGKLLTEAKEAAPHGTWKNLRKSFGLAPTTEYLWRDLFKQVSEEEIDRLIGLNYTISDVIDEYQIGKKKTGQPRSLTGPGQENGGDRNVNDERGVEGEVKSSTQADVEPKPSMDALRVWKEEKGKGGPVVHAANWRGKILCSGRIFDEAADSLGNEEEITCIKCLGILTRERLEAERREREKTPHGSEIGYVWEILEGDDPDAIDARWLPITEVTGKKIITPEKTFVADEPVFRDKFEALETAKAKYQHLVEQDQAEIKRLKAEEDRLKKEKRLAEKRLKRIEALLSEEV